MYVITQPLPHELDATQGQFFKWGFAGLNLEFFLLQDWLPYQG